MEADLVIFDLFGTLFVPNSYTADHGESGRRYLHAFASVGLDTSGMDPELTQRAIWELKPVSKGPGLTLFESRLGEFLHRCLKVTASHADLRRIADHVCADWQLGFHTDPAAHSVLESIRDRLRVSLLSNFDHPPHVRRAIRDARLVDCFEDIVISDEVNLAKPDPQIIRLACSRLDVAPARAIYVGDSYVDYQATTTADMRFIWIHRPKAAAASRATPAPENPYAETDEELRERAAAGEIVLVESLEEIVPLVRKSAPQ